MEKSANSPGSLRINPLRSEHRAELFVGSAGWEHPQWQGCFYPDELPPEWRLTYYNTAFPCVYLDYAEWSGRDLETLAGWVEGTLESFRFVLENNPAGPSEGDRAKLEVLAPRIGPAGGPVVWVEGEPDLKKLAGELQLLAGSSAPIYVISRDHRLAAMKQVKTLLEIMRA